MRFIVHCATNNQNLRKHSKLGNSRSTAIEQWAHVIVLGWRQWLLLSGPIRSVFHSDEMNARTRPTPIPHKVGNIHDPPTSCGVFDVDKIGNLDNVYFFFHSNVMKNRAPKYCKYIYYTHNPQRNDTERRIIGGVIKK